MYALMLFLLKKPLCRESAMTQCNRLRTGTPMITWFMYTDFQVLTYRIFESFPNEISRNFQRIFQENFEWIDPEISRVNRIKFRGIFKQNFQRISRIKIPKFRGFFYENFEVKKSKIFRDFLNNNLIKK